VNETDKKIKELKKEEQSKEDKIKDLGEELEKLKKEEVKEVKEVEEKPEEPEPEPPELPERDKTGKFTKKDSEPPVEEEGKATPTPLSQKEIDELVAEKVRAALKIERKEPSKATQVDEPVNRATIKRNWFEEIV